MKMKYKAMLKSELAREAGVSREVMRKWLKDNEKQLESFGYKRHSTLLAPGAVRFMCEKYVIIFD